MTKFDPHPPLFQPRVKKNLDPLPLLSTPPPTKNLDPHLHFDNSNTADGGTTRQPTHSLTLRFIVKMMIDEVLQTLIIIGTLQ